MSFTVLCRIHQPDDPDEYINLPLHFDHYPEALRHYRRIQAEQFPRHLMLLLLTHTGPDVPAESLEADAPHVLRSSCSPGYLDAFTSDVKVNLHINGHTLREVELGKQLLVKLVMSAKLTRAEKDRLNDLIVLLETVQDKAEQPGGLTTAERFPDATFGQAPEYEERLNTPLQSCLLDPDGLSITWTSTQDPSNPAVYQTGLVAEHPLYRLLTRNRKGKVTHFLESRGDVAPFEWISAGQDSDLDSLRSQADEDLHCRGFYHPSLLTTS